MLQYDSGGASAESIPGKIAKTWRPTGVGIQYFLPNADRGGDAARGGYRCPVTGTSRSHRAVGHALYEAAHKEVLHLIDAEPTVAARMIAGTMKL